MRRAAPTGLSASGPESFCGIGKNAISLPVYLCGQEEESQRKDVLELHSPPVYDRPPVARSSSRCIAIKG